jgi:hypothetical protein
LSNFLTSVAYEYAAAVSEGSLSARMDETIEVFELPAVIELKLSANDEYTTELLLLTRAYLFAVGAI